MTNDLMLEVEEGLRQEKLDNFWREYKSTIISAIILTIVFTAGVSIWRSWEERSQMAATDKILTAVESETAAENLAAVSEEGISVYSPLAALLSAGIFVRDDNLEQAHALYKKAASDSSLPDTYRNLAELMSVQSALSLGGTHFDKTQALSSLNALIADNDNPWRFHAVLQKAVILADYNQDYAAAQEELKMVLETTAVPYSVLKRATSLNHIYKIRQGGTYKDDKNAGETPQTNQADQGAE